MDTEHTPIRMLPPVNGQEVAWPEVEIGNTRTPAVLRFARLLALFLLLGAAFASDLGHVIAASAAWVGLCLLTGDDL